MSLYSQPQKSEAEAMEEFARMLFERYIKGRVSNELLNHSLDGYKASVVSNNGDGTLTVSRPFDADTPLTLRCPPSLADEAVAGDKVLVVALGNMSNAFILCKTDLTGLGGGGGSYDNPNIVTETTAERVNTSRRIRKYILSDTSDDDFICIQDNYVRFITGTPVSSHLIPTESDIPLLTEDDAYLCGEENGYAVIQATTRKGELLYWQKEPVSHTIDGYPLDANGKEIYATTDVTSWPVYQYKYTEVIKSQEIFRPVSGQRIPQYILGTGDENGNSKGYLYKDTTSLMMRYVSSQGKNVDIQFSDQGFVDAMHRRLKSCSINRNTGTMTYTVEGSSDVQTIQFTEGSDSVTFLWPDGFECEVEIV